MCETAYSKIIYLSAEIGDEDEEKCSTMMLIISDISWIGFSSENLRPVKIFFVLSFSSEMFGMKRKGFVRLDG
jgi:hypothetical protein